MDEKEADRKALEYIRKVGLEKQAKKKASHLSSGQKQRLSIARALAKETEIIVADEPTGNLDSSSGAEIMGIIKGLHQAGNTIVLITHDSSVAGQAQRKVYVHDGILTEREART